MQSRLLIIVLLSLPMPAVVYQLVPLVHRIDRPSNGTADLELTPSRIGLGQLAMGEESSVEVQVINRGDDVVRLKPPIAGCGCISPTLDRDKLQPGEQAKLHLVFRAPDKPGLTQKKIVLQARQSAKIWELPITADVVADAWLSPSRMDVAIDREGSGTATGAVKHLDDMKVNRVVSSHPDVLTANLGKRQRNRQWFDVQANSMQDGKGELKFYAENGDEPVATLPVQWRTPRLFACLPREITLDSKQKVQHFEVAVITDSEEVSDLTFEPAVDWIDIQSVKKSSSRITKLVLLARPTRAPSDFEGPVIVVSDDDSGQTAEITADSANR